jgi:tetratricopeptide (TPR) repeat protein
MFGMEVELVKFIGAGLIHACRSLSQRSQAPAIDGLVLAQHLARTKDQRVKSLLEEAAERMCQSWRNISVPDAVAVDHVRCLPAVLEAFDSDPNFWQQATAASLDAGEAETLALDAAAVLIDEARTGGMLQRTGLLVHVSLALVESLFAVLMRQGAALRSILPMYDALVAQRSQCASLPISDTAIAWQDLNRRLEQLAASASDPTIAHQIECLAAKIAGSDLRACRQLLEEIAAQAQSTNEGRAAQTWLFRFLLWSADYCSELKDWTKADVFYSLAANYAPAGDQAANRECVVRRAQALTRAGDETSDTSHYLEAVQSYTRAISLVLEFEAPLEWARIHVAAGDVLLKIARQQPKGDRFATAALHFRPAIAVLSKLEARAAWGLAQLKLGNCLEGHGEIQFDPDLLRDAIFSYRAALGVLTPDLDLTNWARAKAGLGRVIVNLAVETHDTPNLLEAISSLRAALGAGAALDERAKTEAALGRALICYAEETDDHVWLRDGTLILGRALQSGEAALPLETRAKLKRCLATSLWSIGEREGDRTLLDEATCFLAEAREDYLAAFDADAARDISKQIAKNDDVLAAMRRPLRQRVRDFEPQGAKILQFTAG